MSLRVVIAVLLVPVVLVCGYFLIDLFIKFFRKD